MTTPNSNDDKLNDSLGNNQNAGNDDATMRKVTHNLDTGKDEPLPDIDDESIMDFGSGSGGGSAGDGGAS